MSSRNTGNTPRSGPGQQRSGPGQQRSGPGQQRSGPGQQRDPGRKPSKSQMQKKQAAQRAMAAASGARSARNKRMWQVLAPIVTVVVIVGILIGVKAATEHKTATNNTTSASAIVTKAVTGVPVSVTNKVGADGAAGPTKVLSGPPLTENGKPKVLYVGAEWCPYCAAERWALAEAVSRFGKLTNLGETKSSNEPTEPDRNTATLSFHGANYSSQYIALTAKEVENNDHKPLDKLSKSDQALWLKLTGQQGSFPFIDIGGKYQFGVQYNPGVLKGKTHGEIADAMSDPNSSIGQAIDGSANVLTAAICDVTNGQPSTVCTASGVVAAKAKLSAQK